MALGGIGDAWRVSHREEGDLIRHSTPRSSIAWRRFFLASLHAQERAGGSRPEMGGRPAASQREDAMVSRVRLLAIAAVFGR